MTNICAVNGFDTNQCIQLVLEVESLSNHPLAKAISKDIKAIYALEVKNEVTAVKAIQGKGVSAIYKGESVYIGNQKLIRNI